MNNASQTVQTERSTKVSRAAANRVQSRLTVGRSNDTHEQEADRVADVVIRGAGPATVSGESLSSTGAASVQRAPMISRLGNNALQQKLQRREKEEREKQKPEKIQRRENKEEPIQEKVEARANVRDKKEFPELNQVEQKLFSNKGKGEKLDDDTRISMETGFGADFSDVKIHQGGDAEAMNNDLKAQAFTHGKDIFFNTGKYEPRTVRGKTLLAHELTHVVQQGATEQKVPQEKIQQNNAKRNEPSPEPADKEFKQVEQQVENKIKENQPKPSAVPTALPAGKGGEAAPVEKPPLEEGVSKKGEVKGKADAEKGQAEEKTAKPAKGGKVKGKSKAKAAGGGGVGAFLRSVSSSVFEAKKAGVSKLAKNEKTKETAQAKLADTEKAVVPPAEEGDSRAKASQVESVDKTEAPQPDEQKIKDDFNRVLEQAVPTSLEEVDKFKEQGKGRAVGEVVKGIVTADTQEVKATYQKIENPPPAEALVHEPQKLPELEQAPETEPLDMGEGVVGEIQPEHTDLSGFESESDDMLKNEQIKDEYLEMVDEGDLAEANKVRKSVKETVKKGPEEAKKVELQEKQKISKELNQEELQGRQQMREERQKALSGARDDQKKTKSKIELKRQKVTAHINGIYQKANDTVKQKLEVLEKQSLADFDVGEKQATKSFEDNVKLRIDAFKKRRYGRFGGSLLWAKDKLFGMDELPEVKRIFDSEKSLFITSIKALIKKITAENKRVIQECKDLVAIARQEIDTFVQGLGPELRNTGQEAMKEMQGKLNALDKQISDKEKELKKKLEAKREAAIKAIEKKIEQMKESMSGLISKLGNLLLNAMLKFFEWALKKAGYSSDQLMAIINKGKAVIKKIVTEPVAFIGNIIKAVKQGINQFVTNIKKHLISGLIDWLTGAMADVPITLPTKWDLKGILSLVLQILGLTWSRIRSKLVKRLGEKVVKIAETSVDIVKKMVVEGPIGLWNMLKEKAAEIKQKVMDGIRNWVITRVVKQAVIKLLSFLNPAGAIIQAILAIYNTVMFFVENWQRIVDFVTTVFNSISEIVLGKISAAAQKVENAMAMTIPIILNFLARLLGLSGIGKDVSKIINKIRKPIDKVVNKVIDKVAGLAKKLLEKGKVGAKAIKEKGLAVVAWWKQRKKFKTKNGKSHELSFKGKDKIMLASSPITFEQFLKDSEAAIARRKNTADDKEVIDIYRKAIVQYKEIENEITKAKKSNKEQKNLILHLKSLAKKTKRLMELLMEDESTSLLKTKVKYGGINSAGFGTLMIAYPLTIKGEPGSSPSSSLTTSVWKHLNYRRYGNSSYYIKGHLLNDNIHGPGNTWENLTPLSRSGNAQHEKQVESKVKSAVLGSKGVGGTLFYRVVPQYGRSLNSALISRIEKDSNESSESKEKRKQIIEAEKFVPKSLMCIAYYVDPETKKKGKPIVSKQVDNPVDDSHPAKYEIDGDKKVERSLVHVNLWKPFPPETKQTDREGRAVEVLKMIPEIGDFRAKFLYEELKEKPEPKDDKQGWEEVEKIKLIGPKTTELLKDDSRVGLSGTTKVAPSFDQ